MALTYAQAETAINNDLVVSYIVYRNPGYTGFIKHTIKANVLYRVLIDTMNILIYVAVVINCCTMHIYAIQKSHNSASQLLRS